MRALLLLPLLAGALPPPTLLVLRAACRARNPAALAPLLPAPSAVRVLPYRDTCGPGWRAAVARSALAALGEGGAVAFVGWPGARVCRALEAAARALLAEPPAGCAQGAARAAAAGWLARRRGWKRVQLAPAPAGSECRAAQLEVAQHAALVAGSPPDVVIACACDAVPPATAPVLLLHLEEETDDEAAEDGLLLSREEAWPRHGPASSVAPGGRNSSEASEEDGEEAERWSGGARVLACAGSGLAGRDVFVLSDEPGAGRGRLFERALLAARPRPGLPAHDFYLYRREAAAARWSLAALLATSAEPAADGARDWVARVRALNVSRELRPPPEPSAGPVPPVGAALAGLAAAGALGVGALATWRAARRRRRRAGGAVLSPADFSFPADERRRVGEGMESMLSSWLQGLHGLGGPELEPPDLLARPAALSAPSSTCSVNRLAPDRRVRYKGEPVLLRPWGAAGSEPGLRRPAVAVLSVMRSLRHDNINPFIGYLCGGGGGPALAWEVCGRGSLEDVLVADDIELDWTFRLSLLTDLVRGMRYLHGSALRVHGRLSSRACAVDARWVLRVQDYGLCALERAQAAPAPPPAARDLLWTAPELLRDEAARARGSQPGDVYSFAIVMQEVLVRGEPYCMLPLAPDELVEKLRRPPPLIRPSVSMGAAPPDAVSLMRQCWSEAPDQRPDFQRIHDLFRLLHRGRKVNIVDSMFEMLEKYSNNLEELVRERTEQLDMEKKKTEQLLNRMLPRAVAERLLLGQRVEPEEFSCVSVYFSDIVGFTALAARSSPVQVVTLLNDLYSTFDAAIQRYDVYKVETIGDAYMVVGGLPAGGAPAPAPAAHAGAVASMALHLLHLAGRFRVRHLPDTPLHLRSGVHSGPACAAVVGLTMPRYCLFGDTVNTASRMESTGAAWRIQVSAATAALLAAAGGYRLRSRGRVLIKGKGAMHTYWLLGKEGFDRPLPTPPPLPSDDELPEAESEREGSPPPPGERERPAQAEAERAPSPGPGSEARAPAALGARLVSAPSVERARYLRRQWSLERGEALATAAAGGGPRAPPPRYRTRPEPP